MAQIALRAGDLANAEKLASTLIRNLRGGWVFDRAMDVLEGVYESRRESAKARTLRASKGWREGLDTYGAPRRR